MTIKGTKRIARRLSFVIAVLNSAMLLGGIVLTYVFSQSVEVNTHFLNAIVYTLIAALIIDRRFFRSKYDAEQALAQFAAVSRDEVNLDRLANTLLNVEKETMQPTMASVTLIRRQGD